mmetsp:Transcript_33862/g.97241  ORF Transcript_33862/g.97241 Transcript_33862/m.97241 type:complete len:340 (-) Transcript_33862:447-1466(-)
MVDLGKLGRVLSFIHAINEALYPSVLLSVKLRLPIFLFRIIHRQVLIRLRLIRIFMPQILRALPFAGAVLIGCQIVGGCQHHCSIIAVRLWCSTTSRATCALSRGMLGIFDAGVARDFHNIFIVLGLPAVLRRSPILLGPSFGLFTPALALQNIVSILVIRIAIVAIINTNSTCTRIMLATSWAIFLPPTPMAIGTLLDAPPPPATLLPSVVVVGLLRDRVGTVPAVGRPPVVVAVLVGSRTRRVRNIFPPRNGLRPGPRLGRGSRRLLLLLLIIHLLPPPPRMRFTAYRCSLPAVVVVPTSLANLSTRLGPGLRSRALQQLRPLATALLATVRPVCFL